MKVASIVHLSHEKDLGWLDDIGLYSRPLDSALRANFRKVGLYRG